MSDGGIETAAATAAAEVNDEPKVGLFRGVEFTLPPKLPATVALDIAEMQAGGDNLGSLWRLMSGVLGTGQMRRLRDKVEEDGDSFDEIEPLFNEFIALIVGPYGLTPGEH
ncbi:MAG: hypothetical protein ACXVHX_22685 [Solirubrobacteraceae bacterium]